MKREKPKSALSVHGREINYEHRLVDIESIHFYAKNPRIATILAEHRGGISDDVIDEKLWDRNETHKLHRRIEDDGGLIHPILVYKGEVLEGNTRLCCYRHLHATSRDEQWRYIKCHIILDDLAQDEIYRLLCTEHIEGKIEWDAYEKANLYTKMKYEERMKLEQISDLVGESAPTVSYRIKGYKLMVENGIVNKSKYSHFEQLVRNRGIQELRAKDPSIEQKVIGLIKEGKIPKATDVRLIPDICKHKEARRRLFEKKENIKQVHIDLKAKAPMTSHPFMKDVEGLLKRIPSLTRAERDGLVKNHRDRVKLEKLSKELVKLCKTLGIEIHIPKSMRKGKTN